MLISSQYPLLDDFGFPNGIRSARLRWLEHAKQKRRKATIGSILFVVALTIVFGFLGITPWLIQRATTPDQLASHLASRMPMGNAHLGAEYYNIATAVAEGRGFSDPFLAKSGPTAWMPPLLVWIQAGLIWIFGGDRFSVMLAVVLFKTLILAASGAAVVKHGWRSGAGWIAFGVFVTFLFAKFGACFSHTHDSWLILAGVTSSVFALAKLDRLIDQQKLGYLRTVCYGVLGGLVALTSPIAGFAWAVATTFCFARRAPAKLVVAAIISMAVVTPWAIRNQRVFGKFVPIKSNAFFEFDQSQALDPDGLLDWRTMSKHPYHQGPEQDAYVQLGEIKYLATKKERFLTQVKANPSFYLWKVKNRLVGTTLFPLGFNEYSQPSLSLPVRWLLYPWPAIAIIVLLFASRPLSELQRATIVLYVAYLTPYILCSYYPRYGLPLLVLKILLVFWLLELVVKKARHLRHGIT